MHPLARFALVSSVFVVATSGALASVLVVSTTSGPYTTIQAAVNAAQDGDTVLVRPGSHASFTVDDKALSVVGDGASPVTLSGRITVQNLAAARTVVISGFAAAALAPIGTPLVVSQNAGAVRIARCAFRGANGNGTPSSCTQGSHDHGWTAAVLQSNSGGVAFTDCEFVAGAGIPHPQPCYETYGGDGGHALSSTSTQLALYDCVFFGGRGGNGAFRGGDGGHGASITGGFGAVASRCLFVGGSAGLGLDFTVDDGDGGDGVFVAGATMWKLACTGEGGSAGMYGVPGVSFDGASYFTFASTPVELQAPTVVREGTSLALTVRGQPGDAMYLFTSRATDFRVLPSWRGVLLTRNVAPTRILALGTVPASGVLDVALDVPMRAAGFGAATEFLQIHRREASGEITLGSAWPVTVLDASL